MDLVDWILLAPVASLVPAILAFAVVPFGTGVTLFGREVPFQLADLNIGILWVLAMGSLAVYGVVLAGWSSGSNYPLLGGIRSSAQMISYEVGMGLGPLSMSGIVASQDRLWNVIPQFPAFLIYAVAALAETNRPPFDLPEAETELVAGYHTEYSGMRFGLFTTAEYINTITLSGLAVTLFLGGWSGPFLPGPIWFVLKLALFLFVFIWLRATLPRLRYDQLMSFGWKVLLPVATLNALVTAALVVAL